jgi:hypothetical protein
MDAYCIEGQTGVIREVCRGGQRQREKGGREKGIKREKMRYIRRERAKERDRKQEIADQEMS